MPSLNGNPAWSADTVAAQWGWTWDTSMRGYGGQCPLTPVVHTAWVFDHTEGIRLACQAGCGEAALLAALGDAPEDYTQLTGEELKARVQEALTLRLELGADAPGADTDVVEPALEDEMRIPPLFFASTQGHFLLPETMQVLAWCRDTRPHDWFQLLQTGKGLGFGRQDMDDIANMGAKLREPIKPPLVTLQELYSLADAQVPWVVDGLIVGGGLNLLSGDPKIGKSTFVRNIVAGIVQAQRVFRREVREGPVLYYALEEPLAELGRQWRLMGVRSSAPIQCRSHEMPRGVEFVEWLRQDIADHAPVAVVIDPLFDSLDNPDGNDYGTMNRQLKPLAHVARNTGVAIILVHHNRKGGEADFDAILGSTALRAATDRNMLLYRDAASDCVLFRSEGRIGRPVSPVSVEYDQGTERVWFGLSGLEMKRGSERDSFLAVLDEIEEPVTFRQWCTLARQSGVRMDDKLFREYRGNLVDEGRVTVEKGGARRTTKLYGRAGTI